MVMSKDMVEQIPYLYLDKELSTWEIARRLHINQTTALNYLHRLNVPMRPGGFQVYYHPNLDPSPELSYVIGAVLGDGNLSKQRLIRLRVTDRDFAEEFARCLRVVLCKDGFIQIRPLFPSKNSFKGYSGKLQYEVRINSVILYSFLSQTQENLRRITDKFPVEFLRGFYDSEGSITIWHNGGRAHLSLSNMKRDIIEYSQELLCSLDIKSDISVCKIPKSSNSYFRLTVSSKKDVIKFRELVGFSIARKQQVLEKVAYKDERSSAMMKEGF